MDENKCCEVLKEVVGNNNKYFFSKGFRDGFIVGSSAVGLTVSVGLCVFGCTMAICDAVKGAKKNG
ncbi:MAG: hypothetical protein J6Y02_16330 [Pseudobutyrivibrio sp.]|nr:hypothetical protein [Pseudobutyrivibrio sp.]